MAKLEYDLKNFVYDEIIKECNKYALGKRQIDYLSYVWLQWKHNPPRLDPNGEITPTFEERINNEIKHRQRLLSNASKFPVEPEVSDDCERKLIIGIYKDGTILFENLNDFTQIELLGIIDAAKATTDVLYKTKVMQMVDRTMQASNSR